MADNGCMRFFHGSSTAEIHTGLCLTDDIEAAGRYGRTVTVIDIDADALRTLVRLECTELVDRDEQTFPGDDGDTLGADYLTFGDEDEQGRPHDTVRLMTPAALALVTVAATVEVDSDEYEDLI